VDIREERHFPGRATLSQTKKVGDIGTAGKTCERRKKTPTQGEATVRSLLPVIFSILLQGWAVKNRIRVSRKHVLPAEGDRTEQLQVLSRDDQVVGTDSATAMPTGGRSNTKTMSGILEGNPKRYIREL